MTDLPALSGPSLQPASAGKPQQLVLLLHGVGADGNDLIGLAPYFQQILPEAYFFAPNAPDDCDFAPFGYQWFSLGDFSHETRLRGARQTAPVLDNLIDSLLSKYGLSEENMLLIGFSQGTMMALHVGLRRGRQLAGIIGYSGMLLGADILAGEIKSRPPVLLTHGDADEVLPVDSLPAAVAGLEAVGVSVDSYIRPGLGHGIDDESLQLGQRFAAKQFGAPGGN